MARQGRKSIWLNIAGTAAGGLMIALLCLALSHSPVRAQSDVPPDTLAAIDAAVRQADAKAMSAAVIEGISSHPEALEAIVMAAARAAPAYSLGISMDAAAAFPGFAGRIADAATTVTPEIAGTARAIAETRADPPDTSALPPPTPSETSREVRRGILSEFDISLGLGPALRPTYEGGDKFEVEALPLIDITWRDRIFIAWQGSYGEHLRRGLGAKLLKSSKFSVGPYLTYDPGREESESPQLQGMGNVDAVFEAGVFAEWYSERYRFSVDYKQSISGEEGHNGSLLTFAASIGGRINDQLGVGISAWGTYASQNYMIAYYGISAQQSAASPLLLQPFNPETGFKDATADITFRFDWDSNWYSLFIGQWKRLLGDAALSPLIVPDKENQLFLGSTIGYHF
ncbi:MAG: MipA/OmpV family protein [Alphaproteobacteria bacterium]|jgi:outer membrane scaffolding protein for murein synthesis (MipA/OmpV family)|nr:MipA/OmpV family protein [Alphaproteobacteria bacterium]